MTIAIPLTSQQKGFFISLGKELSREHAVRFVPFDEGVANLVRKKAPELTEGMLVKSKCSFKVFEEDAVDRAMKIEETYGVRMSFLVSQDRALGKGYLFNADAHPDIIRSWWTHEKKLASMVEEFCFAEYMMNELQAGAIFAIQRMPAISVVAKSRGIPYYSLAPVKLGTRFLISDNEFLTNGKFIDSIHRSVGVSGGATAEKLGYTQEAGSKYNHSLLQYTWKRVASEVFKQFVGEVKKTLRRSRKPDSYRAFGWVPTRIRRKLAYNYFRTHGKRPEDLKHYRIVYFPLHLEPEISIQGISPEFNNSMEIVAWVSKSIPADAILVVKEQPFSFGIRTKKYYDTLRKIGNVSLAHPCASSWQWIDASSIVVAITGTVGTEAVNFERPVISYGAHQAINHLPTVRYVDSYATTRIAVDHLLGLSPEDPVFKQSRTVFRKCQEECSFELNGFEKSYASSEEQSGMARKVVRELYTNFPAVFGVKHGTENREDSTS